VAEADRVIVMHKGKVLAEATPRKLVASAGVSTVEEAFLALTGGEERLVGR
jgi:ABC-type Na+ transport system ATPase subunit NatA